MSEFNELIKSFAKSREYVRDFFVYGFRTRDEFPGWSGRTYDNERRRVESWLSGYVRQEQSRRGKNIYLSIDSNLLETNPLYRVWKAKSFTDNDIRLHFFILDYLRESKGETVDEITDGILDEYDVCLDSQMVRRKCNEYAREGLLEKIRAGKTLRFRLKDNFRDTVQKFPALSDAVQFYQLTAPLGVLGDTILDSICAQNDCFRVKHSFLVYTLEDEILLSALDAMHNKCTVSLTVQGTRRRTEQTIQGIPLRIFISTRTGRRFLCLYIPGTNRFVMCRMDAVKAVMKTDEMQRLQEGQTVPGYDTLRAVLTKNQALLWGVSFGTVPAISDGNTCTQHVRLTLHIDERREQFILNRLRREHNGGTITHVSKDTYAYDVDVFDANEMLPWIRTFTGRILDIESDSPRVKRVFRQDLRKMYEMYLEAPDALP